MAPGKVQVKNRITNPSDERHISETAPHPSHWPSVGYTTAQKLTGPNFIN